MRRRLVVKKFTQIIEKTFCKSMIKEISDENFNIIKFSDKICKIF